MAELQTAFLTWWADVFSKGMSLLLPLVLLLSGNTAASLDYSAEAAAAKANGPDSFTGLKEVYEDYFPIGTAVWSGQLDNPDNVEHLKKNFNSLTHEWELKTYPINLNENHWDTAGAHRIVDFAKENGMAVRGHTLLWGGIQNWMLYEDEARTVLTTKENFYVRLRAYMEKIEAEFGDDIDAWDVVNEPFYWGWLETYRPHDLLEVCGGEYVEKALIMAREVFGEDDKLFINDTKVLNNTAKTHNFLDAVQKLIDKGVPIDGIGLQCHLDTVSVMENQWRFRSLLDRIRKMGLEVHITELDMRVYTSNEHTGYETLPAWVEQWQINKYKTFFEIMRENADIITNVTFWGMNDAVSACQRPAQMGNLAPRQDWPLLFDGENDPKQAFFAVCDF